MYRIPGGKRQQGRVGEIVHFFEPEPKIRKMLVFFPCGHKYGSCAEGNQGEFCDAMMNNNLSISFPCVHYSSPALMLSMILATQFLQADDWPTFRGPNHDGISLEKGWKASADSPVLWKAQIGIGYSMPVIGGGKVIVAGHDGSEKDTLFCFDEMTGKEIWKLTYPQPLGDKFFQGGTTGTATIDGSKVFWLSREGELFCLEAETGKVLWKVELQRDHGYKKPDWGFTGAPLVQGERVFLTAGDAGMALNKSDGMVIWKSKNGVAGYSTPYPFSHSGKDLIIFTNKRAYVCVDPDTGTEKWRVKWLTQYGVNAADPIISGDHVFLSSGYGKGATLVKMGSSGDPKKVWKNRDMRNQMNGCVLIDGFLYGIDGGEKGDGQGLKCMDLMSGETKWTDKSVGFGTLSSADGKLLVLTESGELQIGVASPSGWKPEMKRKLLRPKVWTVPVLANGKIFCRNAAGELLVVNVKS